VKVEKQKQIFKNGWFTRFAKREKISDAVLLNAVNQAEEGTIVANLGGNVIKQRIARPGQGKSGGYRAIIVFKKGIRSFFVYGFFKSDRENLKKDELAAIKMAAKELLALSDEQLELLVETGALVRITS